MKIRIIAALLSAGILAALSGCSYAGMEEKLDAAGDRIEHRMDAMEDALESAVQTGSGLPDSVRLTKDQAQAIALEHAGFSADQVTYLRTEFEMDDGVPQYEVQFHHGRMEYDYEIHADTGAIPSYQVDS